MFGAVGSSSSPQWIASDSTGQLQFVRFLCGMAVVDEYKAIDIKPSDLQTKLKMAINLHNISRKLQQRVYKNHSMRPHSMTKQVQN